MADTTPQSILADRAVLRISGAEARPFLQGLVTQDVIGRSEERRVGKECRL